MTNSFFQKSNRSSIPAMLFLPVACGILWFCYYRWISGLSAGGDSFDTFFFWLPLLTFIVVSAFCFRLYAVSRLKAFLVLPVFAVFSFSHYALIIWLDSLANNISLELWLSVNSVLRNTSFFVSFDTIIVLFILSVTFLALPKTTFLEKERLRELLASEPAAPDDSDTSERTATVLPELEGLTAGKFKDAIYSFCKLCGRNSIIERWTIDSEKAVLYPYVQIPQHHLHAKLLAPYRETFFTVLRTGEITFTVSGSDKMALGIGEQNAPEIEKIFGGALRKFLAGDAAGAMIALIGVEKAGTYISETYSKTGKWLFSLIVVAFAVGMLAYVYFTNPFRSSYLEDEFPPPFSGDQAIEFISFNQQEDGSLGFGKRYADDVNPLWQTLLSMYILRELDAVDRIDAAATAGFIASHQGEDGLFYFPGNEKPAHPGATALILQSLQAMDQLSLIETESLIEHTVSSLQEDGFFTPPPGANIDKYKFTYLNLLILDSLGALDRIDAQKAWQALVSARSSAPPYLEWYLFDLEREAGFDASSVHEWISEKFVSRISQIINHRRSALKSDYDKNTAYQASLVLTKYDILYDMKYLPLKNLQRGFFTCGEDPCYISTIFPEILGYETIRTYEEQNAPPAGTIDYSLFYPLAVFVVSMAVIMLLALKLEKDRLRPVG